MSFKQFFSIVVFFISLLSPAVALTAKEAVSEAALYKSLKESVDYLTASISKLDSAGDRRAIYAFLGSIKEQLGHYSDAQKDYAKVASIEAGDVPGMPRKSSEQLVIDAVRCALSLGDYVSADRYLDSAIKKSKDEKINAFRNLYSQWSILCKAEDFSEISETLKLLKEYISLESMKAVRPQLLLTLYHLTGDDSYSKKLKTDYPNSMEAGIVKGIVNTLPTPFWYFVPRVELSDDKNGNYTADKTSSVDKIESVSSSKSSGKITKHQLGLFRDEANAKHLVDKLAKSGFSAQIDTEVRPSGTTYYLVCVRENKDGNMAEKLRSAGYDCYPLFE